MNNMKTWKIPTTWQEWGLVEVVADSLAEAMDVVRNSNDIPASVVGFVIDESIELASEDVELVREAYNGGMED